MTVTLGGIILDDNLKLDGLLTSEDVAYSKRKTILGRPVIQLAATKGGRSLSLVANWEGNTAKGYFTRQQLDSIKTLSAAMASVSLVHHEGTFTVLVLGVENLEMIEDLADPESTDMYTATITLIEV